MTREKLLNQIAAYIPYNEQEAADRELILHWIQDHDSCIGYRTMMTPLRGRIRWHT